MLTVLQQKLAEAHGLAIAAAAVTRTVEARIEDADLRRELRSMRDNAEETRARCLRVERQLPEELFDELRAHATSTQRRPPISWGVVQGRYRPAPRVELPRDGRGGRGRRVDGGRRPGHARRRRRRGRAAAWALPVQKRHLETALDAIAPLSTTFDPVGPRWG